MRLDFTILLQLTPLNLQPGTAPGSLVHCTVIISSESSSQLSVPCLYLCRLGRDASDYKDLTNIIKSFGLIFLLQYSLAYLCGHYD